MAILMYLRRMVLFGIFENFEETIHRITYLCLDRTMTEILRSFYQFLFNRRKILELKNARIVLEPRLEWRGDWKVVKILNLERMETETLSLSLLSSSKMFWVWNLLNLSEKLKSAYSKTRKVKKRRGLIGWALEDRGPDTTPTKTNSHVYSKSFVSVAK